MLLSSPQPPAAASLVERPEHRQESSLAPVPSPLIQLKRAYLRSFPRSYHSKERQLRLGRLLLGLPRGLPSLRQSWLEVVQQLTSLKWWSLQGPWSRWRPLGQLVQFVFPPNRVQRR